MPRKREPREEELSDKELLERLRVTPTTELPPMETLYEMYGVPCFYRGELVAVCGKAKSGKTLFLSMIMAACISLRVLWLDTEQSQQSTQEILVKRIVPLAEARLRGEPTSDPFLTPPLTPPLRGAGKCVESPALGGAGNYNGGEVKSIDETFFAYNLRGLGFERRRQLMEVAIATVKPDLVVVDGVKDLVTDINDAVQATLIMEELMALAQTHHCCIVNVLHQNKSEADHNMRGSIGTELTNKAFEVYNCEYDDKRALFIVSQRLSRRERIKQRLCYQLNDEGLPVVCEEVNEQPRDAQGRWTSSKPVNGDLKKQFIQAMEGRTQRPFSELMAVALKRYGMVDAKAFYACVNEAEGQNIIRKVVHPETGITWVELVDQQLPF